MRVIKRKVCVSVATFLLALASAVTGRTIYVDDNGPADFSNIQAAIDDSNNGDIIEVRPGTYTGTGNRDIDFKGNAITVRSTDPNDSNIITATVIDCNGTKAEPHRGFYFHSSEGPDSVLAGITITNGYGPYKKIYTQMRSIGGAI
jgi:pectin methylesterase-like acyl-CoA thioesterase